MFNLRTGQQCWDSYTRDHRNNYTGRLWQGYENQYEVIKFLYFLLLKLFGTLCIISTPDLSQVQGK